METPYIVQRPFETATATIRLDRLLIVVWWTQKNPVDDHPTYDCMRWSNQVIKNPTKYIDIV